MLAVPGPGRPPCRGPGRDRRRSGARPIATPGDTAIPLAEIAQRAGVEPDYVAELVRLEILAPAEAGTFSAGDARRVSIVRSLERAGLSLDAMAAGLRRGLVSLGFADSPVYARFATLTDETFEGLSARSGIPLALLLALREAIGAGTAQPSDRLREDELEVVPFIEIQVRLGFREAAIERLVRVMGDSLHGLAEAEASWFRSEVVEPRLADGKADEITDLDPQEGLSLAAERALLAIYHAQQAQTWMSNIVDGWSYLLTRAGLQEAAERAPAICFLDITGYTRLTQERGDHAAATLAEELARIVQRSSVEHGGRPVKWLGDGVMFFFREPGPAVLAALRMVDQIPAAGLPPAHVGIHAGPVVMERGDYYGQTVNIASRIADYARSGEVLVSQPVVTAADGLPVAFADIGDVELKGVSGAMRLHAARPAG